MKNKRASRRDKKEIKVTYISSPVKVKTSASNFRALVQELTGQYSNLAETSMPMEEENEHLVKTRQSEPQQWRVDEGTNFIMRPEYNELLSRSFMEPFNQQQQLQYDLMTFDMS
ncbi:uncharacterized protein LOC106780797 [Vigna radiata var. radiata]|uniref:Uncharacterized protein LOC106780797 n=1 Tax=Vigna radiata var. radiata TaxID=3916 RepID=A0A1S3W264_VIGRR|nr:uncharacterized protein LOC106780797 [Vigna radiata var. radiata]